ncbi:hypothetical protein PR202_ga25598 [Eleusine coracana subsp. coracana]|uniref:Uncharacterized protein n=1 Tax=Eleusine coracana subsp. coracana TaxID=191504 RepID=A0AAV5DBZ7_ELECO|nr:hypothetical protein PR202_ga25598 [Eleusine coracana subsp. coracana]
MAPALADELMAAASGSRPALADQEGCQGWLRRCVEATLKGFVIGSGLKGGLALLSVVVRLRRLLTGRSKSFSHKPALLRCLFNLQFWCATCREPATATTNAEVVLRAAKDTMRHGIFLGAFAGTYVSADEFISAVWGRNRSAYILNKDSFPSSYKAFLSKQIGKDPVVLQGLKELVNNNDLSSLRRIEKYYETVGVKLKLDPKMKVPCSAYGRALPVYVPVYLLPALAIHRTNLVRSGSGVLAVSFDQSKAVPVEPLSSLEQGGG